MNRSNLFKIALTILILLVVSYALKATLAHGQSRVFGQDFLAAQLPGFNGQRSLQYIPSNSALGTLDYTFGTAIAPIRNLLASGKFSRYRVHLINGSCIASRNCGPYYPFRNYSLETFQRAVLNGNPVVVNFLTTRTNLYCALQKEFPLIDFYISPVLEHRLSIQAYRAAADVVKKACPEINLVNNPVTGDGEKYKGALIESHDGYSKPRDIVSFDGKEATDSDIRTWISRTETSKIAFVWSRVYNCRNQGNWQDPRARTSCPKDRDFELLAHITDSRPLPPTPTFKCSFAKFQSPYIWKPFAEDYGSGDRRSNLPVALVPLKNSDVSIVGVKGHSVGVLKYYGSYAGNSSLNRFYSGSPGGINKSGYQIEKALVDLDESPWAYLKQGGRCIGPFIGGRRQGAFR